MFMYTRYVSLKTRNKILPSQCSYKRDISNKMECMPLQIKFIEKKLINKTVVQHDKDKEICILEP